jgi:predicted NUDIX family NTP pyrophosphohydrolase
VPDSRPPRKGGAGALAKRSAGLLLYRRPAGKLEVLLVHPGGPFWQKKDLGAWTIPKGEFAAGEDPLDAARREFHEETGREVAGPFMPLTPVKQPGGKTVHAWAVEGDFDPRALKSNTFSLEWPPRSGRRQEFPEVDRAAWFDLEEAKRRINRGQVVLLYELEQLTAR